MTAKISELQREININTHLTFVHTQFLNFTSLIHSNSHTDYSSPYSRKAAKPSK
jgi:hypothetical protein